MASTEQAPNQSTAVVVVDHDAGITSTGSEKPGSSTVSPTATMNDGSAASMVHDKEPPASIDVARSRFPYAIAWSPLPLITWVIPFIGHMGLCDAQGRVHDFAGPYTIGVDSMAFGAPTRYLVLDPQKARRTEWGAALRVADEEYSHRMHNLFCDNCHSHVAYALNDMRYNGYGHWNMIILCFWVLFFGKWTSLGGFLKTWLPFLVVVSLVLFFKYAM